MPYVNALEVSSLKSIFINSKYYHSACTEQKAELEAMKQEWKDQTSGKWWKQWLNPVPGLSVPFCSWCICLRSVEGREGKGKEQFGCLHDRWKRLKRWKCISHDFPSKQLADSIAQSLHHWQLWRLVLQHSLSLAGHRHFPNTATALGLQQGLWAGLAWSGAPKQWSLGDWKGHSPRGRWGVPQPLSSCQGIRAAPAARNIRGWWKKELRSFSTLPAKLQHFPALFSTTWHLQLCAIQTLDHTAVLKCNFSTQFGSDKLQGIPLSLGVLDWRQTSRVLLHTSWTQPADGAK